MAKSTKPRKPKPLRMDKDPARDLRYFNQRFGHLPRMQQQRIRQIVRKRALEIVKRERELKYDRAIDRELELGNVPISVERQRELFKPIIDTQKPITPHNVKKISDEIIHRMFKGKKANAITDKDRNAASYLITRLHARAWIAKQDPALINQPFLQAMKNLFKKVSQLKPDLQQVQKDALEFGSETQKLALSPAQHRLIQDFANQAGQLFLTLYKLHRH